MEKHGKTVREGKVKSIGLSNFESERLEEVLDAAEIKPSVLRVECHPYYHIQEGNIVFPKFENPEHIRSNIDIFDFELTDEEMRKIKKMDKNMRFFNMSLAEQEEHLSKFILAD